MKTTVALSIAAILLTVAGGTTMAFAEEGGTYETNTKVQFKEGKDPVKPTDPTDPGKPIDPVDPGVPVGGPLSIDYASNFDFGEQSISTENQTYYAKLDKFKEGDKVVEDLNYVQVSDLRGTKAGWNLTVAQVAQLQTAENEELTGAEITINQANLIAAVDDNSMDNYKPVAENVKQTITLTPDGSINQAVKAEKDKGIGTWVYRFGDSLDNGKTAVQLTVPGKTVKLAKEYTAKLNWTLAAIPSQP